MADKEGSLNQPIPINFKLVESPAGEEQQKVVVYTETPNLQILGERTLNFNSSNWNDNQTLNVVGLTEGPKKLKWIVTGENTCENLTGEITIDIISLIFKKYHFLSNSFSREFVYDYFFKNNNIYIFSPYISGLVEPESNIMFFNETERESDILGKVNFFNGEQVTSFREVTSDNTGGYFIVGEFTEVNGNPRNRICHIRSDGTLGPLGNPNYTQLFEKINGQNIKKLIYHDSQLWLFYDNTTEVSSGNCIIKVDPDSFTLPTQIVTLERGRLDAVEIHNNHLYIAGRNLYMRDSSGFIDGIAFGTPDSLMSYTGGNHCGIFCFNLSTNLLVKHPDTNVPWGISAGSQLIFSFSIHDSYVYASNQNNPDTTAVNIFGLQYFKSVYAIKHATTSDWINVSQRYNQNWEFTFSSAHISYFTEIDSLNDGTLLVRSFSWTVNGQSRTNRLFRINTLSNWNSFVPANNVLSFNINPDQNSSIVSNGKIFSGTNIIDKETGNIQNNLLLLGELETSNYHPFKVYNDLYTNKILLLSTDIYKADKVEHRTGGAAFRVNSNNEIGLLPFDPEIVFNGEIRVVPNDDITKVYITCNNLAIVKNDNLGQVGSKNCIFRMNLSEFGELDNTFVPVLLSSNSFPTGVEYSETNKRLYVSFAGKRIIGGINSSLHCYDENLNYFINIDIGLFITSIYYYNSELFLTSYTFSPSQIIVSKCDESNFNITDLNNLFINRLEIDYKITDINYNSFGGLQGTDSNWGNLFLQSFDINYRIIEIDNDYIYVLAKPDSYVYKDNYYFSTFKINKNTSQFKNWYPNLPQFNRNNIAERNKWVDHDTLITRNFIINKGGIYPEVNQYKVNNDVSNVFVKDDIYLVLTSGVRKVENTMVKQTEEDSQFRALSPIHIENYDNNGTWLTYCEIDSSNDTSYIHVHPIISKLVFNAAIDTNHKVTIYSEDGMNTILNNAFVCPTINHPTLSEPSSYFNSDGHWEHTFTPSNWDQPVPFGVFLDSSAGYSTKMVMKIEANSKEVIYKKEIYYRHFLSESYNSFVYSNYYDGFILPSNQIFDMEFSSSNVSLTNCYIEIYYSTIDPIQVQFSQNDDQWGQPIWNDYAYIPVSPNNSENINMRINTFGSGTFEFNFVYRLLSSNNNEFIVEMQGETWYVEAQGSGSGSGSGSNSYTYYY